MMSESGHQVTIDFRSMTLTLRQSEACDATGFRMFMQKLTFISITLMLLCPVTVARTSVKAVRGTTIPPV